jgi:hypothetical protein
MRIAFVCAGAEPGCDGVGDYSRLLAEELERRGNKTAILALNDRTLKGGSVFKQNQLRLSAATPWSMRVKESRTFLAEFQPKVLSLQFVGYGFDPRGLPLGLAAKLHALAEGVPWHVMFHELWIEAEGGWANRVLSRLQKAFVTDLCRTLHPKKVHTSNPYYASRLESAGIPCNELPLFGNIPVVPHERPRREDEWVFVFFGSLRRGWEPEPLLSKIDSARAAAGKKSCRFLSIGRLGEHGESVWEKMKGGGYENFVFEKRGELDPPRISRSLQECDFGIAVSPLHLLGKSGAVAAMREHGLPVIVNRLVPGTAPAARPWSPPFSTPLGSGAPVRASRTGTETHGDAFQPLILLDEDFEKNLPVVKRTSCREILPEVVDVFLRDLSGV